MERLFKSGYIVHWHFHVTLYIVLLHRRGDTEHMNYADSGFTFYLQYFFTIVVCWKITLGDNCSDK